MSASQCLIVFGLGLDIAGVILIYRYGLPSRYPENEPDGVITYPGIAGKQADPKEQRKFAWLSHSGLACLVLGFLFQIAGTAIIN